MPTLINAKRLGCRAAFVDLAYNFMTGIAVTLERQFSINDVRSVRHTAQARIRTLTCPIPGVGVATSRCCRAVPGFSRIICMHKPFRLEVTGQQFTVHSSPTPDACLPDSEFDVFSSAVTL